MPQLTFASLFRQLTPTDGSVMDELPEDAPSVGVEVALAPTTLRVDLGRRIPIVGKSRGSFVIELVELELGAEGALGSALVRVDDAAAGAAFVDTLAELLDMDAPAPAAARGPLSPLAVDVAAKRTDDGALVLALTRDEDGLFLHLDADARDGALVASDVMGAFFDACARALRDGSPPRLTRKDDDGLSHDEPAITHVVTLAADDRVRFRAAAFGGDALFALAPRADDVVLVRFDGHTGAARDVATLPTGDLDLASSPDGRFVVVRSMHGRQATVHLVRVADGDVRTLFVANDQITMDARGEAAVWSNDGQRFALSTLVHDPRGGLRASRSTVSLPGTGLRALVFVVDTEHGLVDVAADADIGRIVRHPGFARPDEDDEPAVTGDDVDAELMAPDGTWRYLAVRDAGRLVFADRQGWALFRTDGRDDEARVYRIGRVPQPTAPASPVAWEPPDPARVALARQCLTGDVAALPAAARDEDDELDERDEELELAIEELARAGDERALALLDELIETDPESAIVLLDESEALSAWRADGTLAPAMVRALQALDVPLEDLGADDEDLRAADEAYAAHDWDGVLVHTKAALARDPQLYPALQLRAVALTFGMHLDEAVPAYEAALASFAGLRARGQQWVGEDPRGMLHFNRACVLAKLGHKEAAFAGVKDAMAFDEVWGERALGDDFFAAYAKDPALIALARRP